MSREQSQLIRRSDGSLVDVELDTGLRATDLVLIERSWGPVRLDLFNELRASGVDRRSFPQSLHWDWTRKVSDLKLLETTGFGLFFEQRWQGAMLTKTASCVSQAESSKGKPLVYIDYVEAAPWNWPVPPLGRVGEFRGVGSVLIRRAVEQSVQEGFSGRVGLHALPQAEQFYGEVCGMTPLGHDPTKQNLMCFEFTNEQANRFLDEGGAS